MSAVTGARHFHEELAQLKSRLLEMSSMAEELLRLAVEALRERDVSKAEAVVLGDRELDALEVEVDDACIHLLALQQPLARDLRLITMAMKISNDLERVGDHAVNIAESVTHLADQAPLSQFPEIEEMARLAREMLSDALDDLVDALHGSMFRILVTHMMEDPRRIGAAMSMFLISGNLERIADLATNIAEDVVFLVEGRTIKHGAERADG